MDSKYKSLVLDVVKLFHLTEMSIKTAFLKFVFIFWLLNIKQTQNHKFLNIYIYKKVYYLFYIIQPMKVQYTTLL